MYLVDYLRFFSFKSLEKTLEIADDSLYRLTKKVSNQVHKTNSKSRPTNKKRWDIVLFPNQSTNNRVHHSKLH